MLVKCVYIYIYIEVEKGRRRIEGEGSGGTKHGVESKKKRREGKRRAELESSSKKPIESVQWLRAIPLPPL